MNLFVQILGILAMGVGALSLMQKKTTSILLVQIISATLFATHFFLLGAFAGASLNILSLLRNIIIYFKKRKWATPKVWFPLFALFFAVAVYLSGDGLLGILPFAGCIFMSIGLHIDNSTIARRYIICSSPCWLIYNAINLSIGGVIAEIINLVSLISSIVRYDIKKQ